VSDLTPLSGTEPDAVAPVSAEAIAAGLTHNAYVLEGLAGAASRLEASRTDRDVCTSFIATCEALMWVMVLDDRFNRFGPYINNRAKHEYGRGIPGMRHIWNLLKHTDLDDLVDVSDGAAWPIQWPITFFELTWKPLAELPIKSDAKKSQTSNYDQYLAGKPIRLTLGGAIDFIRREAVRLGYQRRGLPASQLPPGITPRQSQL